MSKFTKVPITPFALIRRSTSFTSVYGALTQGRYMIILLVQLTVAQNVPTLDTTTTSTTQGSSSKEDWTTLSKHYRYKGSLNHFTTMIPRLQRPSVSTNRQHFH